MGSDKERASAAWAARLLGVTLETLLRGDEPTTAIPRDGTLLGGLFESLVTLGLRVYAQAADASVSHLRTRGGRHEVDLILARQDQRLVAVEVKLSSAITDDDVKHLHWLREQIGRDFLEGVVINTGTHAYRRKDGIAVVPAALLGP